MCAVSAVLSAFRLLSSQAVSVRPPARLRARDWRGLREALRQGGERVAAVLYSTVLESSFENATQLKREIS